MDIYQNLANKWDARNQVELQHHSKISLLEISHIQQSWIERRRNRRVEAYDVYVLNQIKIGDKPDQYERKYELLNVINQLKQFQDDNGQQDYRKDLDTYFRLPQQGDRFRQIFDHSRESYDKKRNTQNIPIYIFMSQKKAIHESNPQKVDEWGFPYTISPELILQLPVIFKFNEQYRSYQLEGKLTNQFAGFHGLQNLSIELGYLVTHFSQSLKEVHNLFKYSPYSNQLFEDQKRNVSFDQEIRAFVQIFEMELAPQQEYVGRLHKEGQSVDGVLYSCLYVIQQDGGLDNGHIKFSRYLDEGEANTLSKIQYGGYTDGEQDLGYTYLKEDLMVIFPNRNQHYVTMQNTTSKIQKRIAIQLSVVNHCSQPFSINDHELTYSFNDKPNELYESKTQQNFKTGIQVKQEIEKKMTLFN